MRLRTKPMCFRRGIAIGLVVYVAMASASVAERVVRAAEQSDKNKVAVPELPAPFKTPSVTKYPKVTGWPKGKTPKAADGFMVNLFAEIESPRWIYVLPNGDVLIAESRTLPPPP